MITMLGFKKIRTDNFLNFALLLSFLNLNSVDLSWDTLTRIPLIPREVALGQSFGYYLSDYPNFTDNYHLERSVPYKIPNTDFYERNIFRELNELGSYSRNYNYDSDVYAYLLNNSSGNQSNSRTDEPSRDEDIDDNDQLATSNDELSPEDVELIEVLWKQDIDLGIHRDVYDYNKTNSLKVSSKDNEYKNLKNQSTDDGGLGDDLNDLSNLNYTIDTETGELIFLPPDVNSDVPVENDPVQQQTAPETTSDEISDFFDNFEDGVDFDIFNNLAQNNAIGQLINSVPSTLGDTLDSLENETKLDIKDESSEVDDLMTNQLPLNGFEESWQDFANLLEFTNNITSPYVGEPNRSIAESNINMTPAFQSAPTTNLTPGLIKNATLPVPAQPITPSINNTNVTLPVEANFTTSLLAPSITNGTDPQVANEPGNFSFDGTFFNLTNNHTEPNMANQTSGFLSGLLSDEDLELMGLAINQPTADNVNQNTDNVDVSSDSAVSSIGSERFPSFSDSEWFDSSSEISQQDHHERNFGTEISSNGMHHYGTYLNSPPVANTNNSYNMNRDNPPQKKYNFYGKKMQESCGSSNDSGNEENQDLRLHNMSGRYPDNFVSYGNDSGEVEGATAMVPSSGQMIKSEQFGIHDSWSEFINHNHTYGLPPEKEGEESFPGYRDKLSRKAIRNDKGLSRDERRAKDLRIPLGIEDMVNLSMDEFNEKISKYDFSETQLTLVRDIRRRGKNKVAAQNCRKRKLDQIYSLEDDLRQLRNQRDSARKEKENLFLEKETSYYNFKQLHDEVLKSLILRQHQQSGISPYPNPENYTLQLTPDGSVYVVPRNSSSDYKPSNFKPRDSK